MTTKETPAEIHYCKHCAQPFLYKGYPYICEGCQIKLKEKK